MHQQLRRLLVPFIHRYVAVSADLHRWLKDPVGIPDAQARLIINGVDTERFRAPLPAEESPEPWATQDAIVIGTVGRLQDVKDHATLIEAFGLVRRMLPVERPRLRLAIVGDGPLTSALAERIASADLSDCAWLAGPRSDVAAAMRSFSLFALPSIAEGTPVTLLEAMATELPVVASAVGGIPELVVDGSTGTLVPPRNPYRLAQALAVYIKDLGRARRHGAAARERVEQHYGLSAMLHAYLALYDELCKTRTTTVNEAITPCAE